MKKVSKQRYTPKSISNLKHKPKEFGEYAQTLSSYPQFVATVLWLERFPPIMVVRGVVP